MIPMHWKDWIRGCVIAALAGAVPTISSVWLHPSTFMKNWKECILTALTAAWIGVRVWIMQAPFKEGSDDTYIKPR
jgi:hypothetical protein